MKEVIIRNEFDKSYLLIRKEGLRENYIFKMLTLNHIPGILECKVRYLEEYEYLAYDVTGKRTLEKEFATKKMQFSDISELFYKINKTIHGANEYLLDCRGFRLDPQYMYIDLETGELDCLYYPESNGDSGEERYRKFADFLLDRIDHRDEHAVNIAYHFYKISKEDYFSFDSFIGFLEKEQLLVQARKQERERKEERSENSIITETDSDTDIIEQRDTQIAREDNIGWKGPVVILVLGVTMIVGYFIIPGLHPYIVWVLVPGIALTIIAIICIIRKIFCMISQHHYFSYDEPQEPIRVEEYFDTVADDMTVFFDEEEFLKLKWKEGHFSKEYILKEFPITVGKLKGSVGVVIEDPSISRLHARFRQQGNMVYLQDLESTNRTYVNHKVLLTGEETVIKRGDEIQFGKIIVNVV